MSNVSIKSFNKGTVDEKEIEQFDALANQWWDAEGDFALLHKINPVRLKFIRDSLCDHFRRLPNNPLPLKQISIVDIGCGGGLLCEPLSRLGAIVTGLDAGRENIKVAKLHAKRSNLDIIYKELLPEDAVKQNLKFDVVVSMEVIEHVSDPKAFIGFCSQLVRPGGVMLCATINRTIKSLALAKISAEYIFGWLPRGTHDWRKFLKPSELCRLLREETFVIEDISGFVYKIAYDEWILSNDVDINYVIYAKKI